LILTFDHIKENLLKPSLSESDLLKGISRLRDRYTQNRVTLKTEKLDAHLVSAYTLFYMTTNMEKLPFVLKQLEASHRENILKSQLIDFGCGPGTFAWGLLHHYPTEFKRYLGVDHDPLMLEAAEKLRQSLGELNCSIEFSSNLDSISKFSGEKTLIFSHSMNELEPYYVDEIIKQVNPTYLLFVEPGTSEVFSRLMLWREKQKDFMPLYPCASQSLNCPLAKVQEGEDWCHQLIRQSLDPELERLSQISKIDRRTQAMIAHLYVKSNLILAPIMKRAQIIRFIKETKFSYLYQICLQNKFVKIEILKKEMKGRKDLSTLLAPGQFLNYEILKTLEPDYLRVRIID
jgi:ribosomal protein RSM22 (predicted rRNA methylase)